MLNKILKKLYKSSKVKKAGAVLFALAVWQAAAMLINSSVLLASPIQVLLRLCTIWRDDGFFSVIGFSFVRIVGGFLLGLFIGCLLAVLAGKIKIIETLLWPFMITVKSIPVASFIVIALIWLSSRQLSVFISFLMVLPIIYTNILQGIKSIDPKMNEMAGLFGVLWHKRFIYIWMPQIKPFLMSSCSVALGLSWKAGVAAEIIGIPSGSMGEMLYNSKVYLDTDDLFAWTVIIVVISVLFEKLFMYILGRLFAGMEKRHEH